MSSFHVCIEAMIGGPPLILVFQALLRRLLGLAVNFGDSLRTKIHVCMDEYPQTVRLVPQNIIGTPSHNDTRAFFCQLCYNSELNVPQVIGIVWLRGMMRKRRRQKASGAYSPASWM